jgi:hypothetical protein
LVSSFSRYFSAVTKSLSSTALIKVVATSVSVTGFFFAVELQLNRVAVNATKNNTFLIMVKVKHLLPKVKKKHPPAADAFYKK